MIRGKLPEPLERPADDADLYMATADFECRAELFDGMRDLREALARAERQPEGCETTYCIDQLDPPQFYPGALVRFLDENTNGLTGVEVNFTQGNQTTVSIDFICLGGGKISAYSQQEDRATYTLDYVPAPLYEGHIPEIKNITQTVPTEQIMQFLVGLALTRDTKIKDRLAVNSSSNTLDNFDFPRKFNNSTIELLKNSLNVQSDLIQQTDIYQLPTIIDEGTLIDTELVACQNTRMTAIDKNSMLTIRITPESEPPTTLLVDIQTQNAAGLQGNNKLEISQQDSQGRLTTDAEKYSPYILEVIKRLTSELQRD